MLDLNTDGYVDLKEFVHGFFKVYYSNLDAKIKLAFDMYVCGESNYIGMTSTKMALLRKKTWDLYCLIFPLKKQFYQTYKEKADSLKMEVESKFKYRLKSYREVFLDRI